MYPAGSRVAWPHLSMAGRKFCVYLIGIKLRADLSLQAVGMSPNHK
jgi:hypothetical protein